MVVMGPSRQLLASREEEEVTERGTYPPVAYNQTVNQTCILFWAATIQISKGGHVVDLTNRTFGPGATVDVSSSTCTNQTANLVLEYENVEELALSASFSGCLISCTRYLRSGGSPWTGGGVF
ncbi:V-type proton ATPase subunit S1-like [Chiloscyllium punctatum]|uniref:V-type proton ATPase subunit S1-like n=1 Tax=Chiloscyllium punctatum TaxID=137246 RepID=UPI003B637E91